jgi:hypothetical protein
MTSKQVKEMLRSLKCYSEAFANQWLKQHPKANYTSADLSSLLAFLRNRQSQRQAKRCQTVAEAMISEKQRQQELPRKSRQLSVWA